MTWLSAIVTAPEHLPWRGTHRSSVVPRHIAQHERGRLEPWDAAQGSHVGMQVEVAITAVPVGDLVTRYRIHLHVEGQELVAALHRLLVRGRLHEVLGVHAFAHEAALHVRER